MQANNKRKDISEMTPEEIVSDIGEKISTWFSHLNEIIGATSFALGLGCLGTAHPQIYALLSLFFVFGLIKAIARYSFPNNLKKLKDKKNKSDLEEVLLKGMESHFFNLRKTFIEAPVYWLGITFLIFVFAGLNDFINTIMRLGK